MIKKEREGNRDVFPTFAHGLGVVWHKLFIKTAASKKRNICLFHVVLARCQIAWWYLRLAAGPLSHLVVIS